MKKYIFGKPYETMAVVYDVETTAQIHGQEDAEAIQEFSVDLHGKNPYNQEEAMVFATDLKADEIVYGLGETMHGIKKNGHQYISYNTDDPHHKDNTKSLYGSHNFLVIGKRFGVFFDTPSRVTFDVDLEDSHALVVYVESSHMNLYIVDAEENEGSYDIVKKFRKIIGHSFVPPLWAFGYCQSRWGYRNQRDVTNVVKGYRKANIPLDSVCMDIDYMDRYIDFTINEQRFPNLKEFAQQMLAEGIHLVPIIDAGVKIEPGNEVYDEGVEKGYFCTNHEGKPFSAAVWPGMTHFPDFFQPEARTWFGSKYKVLTDCGIEGYWNDMNEPAIFYSEYSPKQSAKDMILGFLSKSYAEKQAAKESNAYKDYKNFYHLIDGKKVLHHEVHNLYGGLMTMADNEGLNKLLDHRFLLYSRASYIGAHRYGGIWTGDNSSCWEHLRVNVCQMASLNMCGFLYTGADTGGFGGNTNRELLLRWLAFSSFTPLMRNHASMATKKQECYRFEHTEDFRKVINLRYRLLPYIYSEFVKAALKDEMYMRPLAFDYPEDERCKQVEDQLMVGEDLMVAPVIEEGAKGRRVYLPEDMIKVTFDGENFTCLAVEEGEIDIEVALNEVVFFVKKGHAIVVANQQVQTTRDLDLADVMLLGDGEAYMQYRDDGLTKEMSLDGLVKVTKEISLDGLVKVTK